MEIYTDRDRLLLGFLFRATIKAKRGFLRFRGTRHQILGKGLDIFLGSGTS